MFVYIFVFVLGAVLASFMHVYVTRLLRNESIVKPRSHCINCNHILQWYELIPIVSYIIQKGRCRCCNEKIGLDSVIIEIMTGLLFILTFAVYGFSYKTLLGFVIILIMISVFLSDFKEMIILDSTLLVGVILIYIIVFLDIGLWKGIYKSFMYGVFAFVLMVVVKVLGDAAFKRDSLGGGDIKLAFLMGSILPYNLFLVSIVIGSSCALPYAIYISISKKTNELAFGPFLVLGLYITFMLQGSILEFLNMLVN